jgi:hypothetical protein
VASIGWRFVHLIGDNEIYMEYAFGPGLRSFPDLPVHGTADEVLADWENSCRPVTAWLASARDSDLLEPRPSHLGGSSTAGDVMTILLDEQIHHGAEIALLRDLYRRFKPDPDSWQCPLEGLLTTHHLVALRPRTPAAARLADLRVGGFRRGSCRLSRFEDPLERVEVVCHRRLDPGGSQGRQEPPYT